MAENGGGKDRYFSNEWIKPIAREAKPIFAQFPRNTAIEVANAVLIGADTGETQIPWVTVFPSDDKRHVGSRLSEALRTPDYRTPAYNPDMRPAVEELSRLLIRHQAEGLQGKHAAFFLVREAAEKEDELFATYQDLGRKWPQYATDWIDALKVQFGEEGYEEIRAVNPESADLLKKTAAIADLHYQQKGQIQQSGESTADHIRRGKDFFDIQSVDDLREAARILDGGFEGYRRAAYQLRKLPPPISE